MSEWKKVRLGEVLSIKHGYAFPGEGIVSEDNGVVLVTPGNFLIGGGFKESGKKFFRGDYPSEYQFAGGELVVTMTDLSKTSDTLGVSAKIPFSKRCVYLHNQRIGLVTITDKSADEDFIYWFMRTDQYRKVIVAGASGTTVKHTSPSRIRDVELRLPPLPTQRKIAAVLGALDDKIENNRKICANLEAQAQAIFKSWFVDFEPFGGKMPQGWKMGKLGDVADITMGQSPDGKSLNDADDGITFFQGRAEFGNRFPTKRLSTTEPNRMAKAGDVLLSVRAPVGDLNIALEGCCIGRGLAAIRSKAGSQSFIYCLLKTLKPAFDLYEGSGTIFGSINKDSLHGLDVVIPEGKWICQFESVVSSLDRMIRERELESRALAEMRDALLPKLMSGEIDVEKVKLV